MLDPPIPGAFLDFQKVFGNKNPVEMEIGFGKGAYLVESATRRPGTNYFGLEHEKKYAYLTASRLARRCLENCRVMAADGAKILGMNVPPGSLRAVHLYFPDPWWKTRHHKRRILTPTFLTCVAKGLGHGHLFHLATDVREYFFNSLKMLETSRDLALLNAWQSGQEPVGDAIVTNFERKALAQGHTIHRLTAISTSRCQ